MAEEEKNVTVKQGNPFAAAFKSTLGKGCGCVALIVIAIAVIAGIGSSGNKSTTGTQPATQTGTSPTVTPQEAIKITANQLADDFDANQVAAETNWSKKLVEFTAEISNITDSGLSFTKVGSKQYSMTQISCKITDKQQVLSLKNGQTVTVRGVVGKQFLGVIDVSDCKVVK